MARLRRRDRKTRLDGAQHDVDARKKREPALVLVRRPFGGPIVARVLEEQFVDADPARISARAA